jgi:hypothetical protein
MATPGNNVNSVSGLLKRWYRDGGVVLTTFTGRYYWTTITKKADSSQTEGSSFQFAIMTNDIQARNTIFTAAQAQARGLSAYSTSAFTSSTAGPPNVGAMGITQFTVPRVMNYAYANISTELQLASRTKRGAFDSAVTRLTDSALNVLGNDQEIGLFGGSVTSTGISTASTGFISAIGASTDVTSVTGKLILQYPFDVNKFSVGQELDLYYNNANTITKRTNIAGTGLFVGSVDRTNGYVYVVNAAGSAIAINSVFSNAATTDLICVSNDFNLGAATGASGTGKILGFESWVPFGGPVADSANNLFCGVNRNSGDLTRLAGNWLDATGATGPNAGTALNIEDSMITMSEIVSMQSDKEIDTYALNFNQHTKLLKSNVARTIVENKTNIPNLSFKGLEVMTSTGPAMVIPSRFCGTNRVYGLHWNTWSFIHLGDPVEMYQLDGNSGLARPTWMPKRSGSSRWATRSATSPARTSPRTSLPDRRPTCPTSPPSRSTSPPRASAARTARSTPWTRATATRCRPSRARTPPSRACRCGAPRAFGRSPRGSTASG